MVVRNHINELKVWYLESHIQMYIFSLVLHLDGIHLTPHRNFAHLRIEHSTSSYEYILTEFPRSGEELTQCHSSITPISYTKSQFIASVVKQHHSIWQPSLWGILLHCSLLILQNLHFVQNCLMYRSCSSIAQKSDNFATTIYFFTDFFVDI